MPTSTVTVSPTVQAMLDFLREVLIDLAEELRQDYDDVEIRLSVTAR